MRAVNTTGLDEWVGSGQRLQIYILMSSLCPPYEGKEMTTPKRSQAGEEAPKE